MAEDEADPQRLPHGYNNLTRRIAGGRIEKRYESSYRCDRARVEAACLTALAGRVPVPVVIEVNPEVPMLVLAEEPGVHGQELIDAGRATEALGALGTALRSLHRLGPQAVPGLAGSGSVVVHGDFGPQNALVDPERREVTAILDWEFAHVGEPIEDLSWAEWIVRMHHPDAVEAIPALYSAYGEDPPWSARHAAMVRQCEYLIGYCDAKGSREGVAVWEERRDITVTWTAHGERQS